MWLIKILRRIAKGMRGLLGKKKALSKQAVIQKELTLIQRIAKRQPRDNDELMVVYRSVFSGAGP